MRYGPRNEEDVPLVSIPQRLSRLFDIILKPSYILVPSYITDDVHLLNHIETRVNKETICVTFDVLSLYIDIYPTLRQGEIDIWIHKHPKGVQKDFPRSSKRYSKEFKHEGPQLVVENTICLTINTIFKYM